MALSEIEERLVEVLQALRRGERFSEMPSAALAEVAEGLHRLAAARPAQVAEPIATSFDHLPPTAAAETDG